MKTKKEKIIAILLVVGLIVVTGSISYAAFRFTGLGSKVNTITTGSITMSYTESSNVLSMSGALPTTDTTGKVRLNPGEYFDFTVSSSITGDTNINYEIAVEELDGSTMSGDYIKFYLTKLGTDGSEQGIFGPSTYTKETESNTYTGRPANMMSLYTSSMTVTETTTYRLRMYVSEEYNPQGDGGNLTYKARVNVYGLAGNKIEGEEELDLSTVNTDLTTNTWEDVQKVVKAGKAAEAGWSVGDTKEVEINGQTKTATIIGLDHDGENTATFMVMSNIGSHVMNSDDTNEGGWEASEMRAWLNGDIYNSMTDTKDYIKEVTKMTDNVGYSNSKTNTVDDVTATQDKVFLLSVAEVGLQASTESDYGYTYMNQINGEGTTYEWFKNNNIIRAWFWLRSPYNSFDSDFFGSNGGAIGSDCADGDFDVFAAFVIG